MVGGLWRRMRSILASGPSERGPRRAPTVPPPPIASDPPPTDTTAGYVLDAPPPEPEPRPVAQLAESLAERLAEDESVRGDLADDEFQPLLDWAMNRIQELAKAYAALPPRAAEARFNQTAAQLVELLRTVSLAVGGRDQASPDFVVSRFQLLDTLLVPPLLPGPVASVAQARLEALLAEPPEQLQAADGPSLVRRILDMCAGPGADSAPPQGPS